MWWRRLRGKPVLLGSSPQALSSVCAVWTAGQTEIATTCGSAGGCCRRRVGKKERGKNAACSFGGVSGRRWLRRGVYNYKAEEKAHLYVLKHPLSNTKTDTHTCSASFMSSFGRKQSIRQRSVGCTHMQAHTLHNRYAQGHTKKEKDENVVSLFLKIAFLDHLY